MIDDSNDKTNSELVLVLAFRISLSTNMKLLKTRLSKMVQLGGFFSLFLRHEKTRI